MYAETAKFEYWPGFGQAVASRLELQSNQRATVSFKNPFLGDYKSAATTLRKTRKIRRDLMDQ
jgi:hypothetical protein